MEKFTSLTETSVKAKKVVLAVGYHDVYLDIPGLSNVVQIRLFPVLFVMVTNRDSVWGISAIVVLLLSVKLMGAKEKYATITTIDIPPNIAIIPMIIVRIAMIVTPVGLLTFSVNNYTVMATEDLYKIFVT
ncbi:MAG TPA: hypothetical protein VKA09_11220 [Nitrososphaeraceae archaeon]|nr:hypothetical protein [Nitrososphaeraceae archaeon]